MVICAMCTCEHTNARHTHTHLNTNRCTNTGNVNNTSKMQFTPIHIFPPFQLAGAGAVGGCRRVPMFHSQTTRDSEREKPSLRRSLSAFDPQFALPQKLLQLQDRKLLDLRSLSWQIRQTGIYGLFSGLGWMSDNTPLSLSLSLSTMRLERIFKCVR